jgi:hypothetical protein
MSPVSAHQARFAEAKFWPSGRASSHNEMQDQGNHREDKQKMDQSASHVEHREAA